MVATRSCRDYLQLKAVVFFLVRTFCLSIFTAVFSLQAWAEADVPERYLKVHHVQERELFANPSPGETLFLFPTKDNLQTDALDPGTLEWFAWDYIRVPNHPAVQRYVKFYRTKGRRTFEEALKRSWAFVPTMMEILSSYGLPRELVYTVMIESRFLTKSRSARGAAGFWQFMPATARAMGLTVNYWIDERLDPIKSTHAAARYLRKLYNRFGSWPLALAAYNAGAGAVSRAIRKTKTRDFWEISKRRALPLQTRQYVPKVLAAISIVRHLGAYNFIRPRYLPIHSSVSVGIRRPLSLRQVSRWTGIPLKRLRTLNPALRHDRVPKGMSFQLRLPAQLFERFSKAYEKFIDRKA